MKRLHLRLNGREVEGLIIILDKMLPYCLLELTQVLSVARLSLFVFLTHRVDTNILDKLVSPRWMLLLILLFYLEIIVDEGDKLLSERKVAQSDLLDFVEQEVENHILYIWVRIQKVLDNIR